MTGKTVAVEPRNWLSNAIGGAWKLMKLGPQPEAPDLSPLYGELKTLVAPHFPVLVYKREKYADDPETAGKWKAEVDRFVERVVLPQLDEDPALAGVSAQTLAETVDAIVAGEQQRLDALDETLLPSTARFEDTNWAT
jgi:hypothetical protein